MRIPFLFMELESYTDSSKYNREYNDSIAEIPSVCYSYFVIWQYLSCRVIQALMAVYHFRASVSEQIPGDDRKIK